MSGSEDTHELLALGRALDRLGEALDQPEDNPLAIDGTIQRFEFAIELCDRNETSHTYNEKTARRVYASIRSHLPELERTYDGLRARFPA